MAGTCDYAIVPTTSWSGSRPSAVINIGTCCRAFSLKAHILPAMTQQGLPWHWRSEGQ
jgi:hypothetical protein